MELARLVQGFFTRLNLGLRAMFRRAPQRLLIAPYDLRTSDPTVAGDIYGGYFVFSGKAVSAGGASPFDVDPPSLAWGEGLYAFGWLRHLRAADSVLSRSNARALVDEFLRRKLQKHSIARSPLVEARRMIAFLTQSPLLLEGAEHDFYRRFLKALHRSVALLEIHAASAPTPRERLWALIALSYAGLCLEGGEAILKRLRNRLEKELEAQILPDGGHVSRHPQVLMDLMLDLLPLRQTYQSRGLEPPQELSSAIDRMGPMLRLLRHGDGTLALFNGMSRTPVDHVATLLMYDESRARPIRSAPHSGYERLEAGNTVLIMDVGSTPPLRHSMDAHGGCLSFECSSNGYRIIVNCGAPRGGSGEQRIVTRLTAAHSTAGVQGASQIALLNPQGWWLKQKLTQWLERRLGIIVLQGVGEVEVARLPDEAVLSISARHQAYAAYGLIHQRSLYLEPDGRRLEGRDSFTTQGPVPVSIRFHLHPDVKVVPAPDGELLLLRLANGEMWRFTADSGDASLEAGAFFAATDGLRRAQQIVLRCDASQVQQVNWVLERVEPGQAS